MLEILFGLRLILNLIWQMSGLLMISVSLIEIETSRKSSLEIIPFYLSLFCGLIIILTKMIEMLSTKVLNKINKILLPILIIFELVTFCWSFIEFDQENAKATALTCFAAYITQILLMITKIPERNYRTIENFRASMHMNGVPFTEVKELIQLNKIKELSIFSKEFKELKQYFDDGRAHNFNKKIEIRKCYLVNNQNQLDRFEAKEYHITDKLTLWHGTKIRNVKGIVQEGFRLPEDDRGMFGRGIYFADRMSKSAQYCDQQYSGVMFLCTVALGNMLELTKAHRFAEQPEGYDSVKGIGQFEPDPTKATKRSSGVPMPVGPTIAVTERRNFDLKFNEYVVYDPDRIVIENIVKFKWISDNDTEC